MAYSDAYARVKSARGGYDTLLTLPDSLAAPSADAMSEGALADARSLRELTEMVLVRAYADWYTGAPEANVSQAIHHHCTRLAEHPTKVPMRRAGALLALCVVALDDGGDDAWMLVEHVLPDLLSGASTRDLPVRWLSVFESTLARWRVARKLPPSLARLESSRYALWLEILRWEVVPRSSLTGVRAKMDQGFEGLGKVVPAALSDAVEEALSRGVQLGFDAAQSIAGFDSLRASVRARGYTVDRPADLLKVPLEELSDEAQSTVRWACTEATVLGAATGAVGIPGLVADLPALMTLNLRLLARMSLLHGFDVAEDGERQFALNLLGASSSDGTARAAFLTNLNGLSVDLAHHKTRDEVSQHVLVGLVRQLARMLAARLTKRGLARMVPVLGGVVGAGVNYQFTAQTARAAWMVFRKRWLIAHLIAGEATD